MKTCERRNAIAALLGDLLEDACEYEATHAAIYEDGDRRVLCPDHAAEAAEAGVEIHPLPTRDEVRAARREELAGRWGAFREATVRPIARAQKRDDAAHAALRRTR
jgi:hypothetical protein